MYFSTDQKVGYKFIEVFMAKLDTSLLKKKNLTKYTHTQTHSHKHTHTHTLTQTNTHTHTKSYNHVSCHNTIVLKNLRVSHKKVKKH